MLKYISGLSNDEIKNYLLNCSLIPITFNNFSAIKRTKNKILVTCIKNDSLFYKTILDWNEKKNIFGDTMISFVDKSEFENFITISINDFYVKILDKNRIHSKAKLEENNKLKIDLNNNFLKLMTAKFQKTKYIKELNNQKYV